MSNINKNYKTYNDLISMLKESGRNFDIEKILESPLLTFNRENASLTLNSVENASEYILSLNNNKFLIFFIFL